MYVIVHIYICRCVVCSILHVYVCSVLTVGCLYTFIVFSWNVWYSLGMHWWAHSDPPL